LWATKSGQFEDTYGPSVRILFEDEVINKQNQDKNKNQAECK
jgi:cbb3-type cytochrome oxidase maturation protein